WGGDGRSHLLRRRSKWAQCSRGLGLACEPAFSLGLACEPAWSLGVACEPAWSLGVACEPAWSLGLAWEPAWEDFRARGGLALFLSTARTRCRIIVGGMARALGSSRDRAKSSNDSRKKLGIGTDGSAASERRSVRRGGGGTNLGSGNAHS